LTCVYVRTEILNLSSLFSFLFAFFLETRSRVEMVENGVLGFSFDFLKNLVVSDCKIRQYVCALDEPSVDCSGSAVLQVAICES